MPGRKRLHHGRCGRRVLGLLAVLALLAPGAMAATAGRIERVELEAEGPPTRVVIKLSRPLVYEVHVLAGDPARRSARRLVLDFADATLAPDAAKPIEGSSGLVRQIRPGQFNARTARIVLDLADGATHSIGATASPPEVTIALDGPPPAPGAAALPDPAAGIPSAGVAPPPVAAEVPPPGVAVAPPPVAAAVSDVPRPVASPRKIPIRARGRRPYSLIYSR